MPSDCSENWTFAVYEKIAESPERWRLEPTAYRQFRKASWVVTEKIHGANFCFVIDGTTVRCANRRQFLEEYDDFFGYQTVRDKVGDAVRETFAMVQKGRPEIALLFVYGELFGGGYPHPDATSVPGVAPVQTGIWYAPDVRFCAFDLRIEEEGDGERRYLDYAEAVAIWERAGMLYASPLRIGAYEQAMEYPARFDSTLPRRLGLPPLPTGTNLAEGVVVKPLREIQVPSEGGMIRPVLKRKIPEFAEDRRFHEAEKPNAPAYDGALDLLKWEAYCRVTENRLRSALSKIGPRAGRDDELLRLLVEDILEEVQATKGDAWCTLNSADRSHLTAYVQAEVQVLLQTHPV